MADTPDTETDAKSNDADNKLLDEAHARFKLCEDAENEHRTKAIEVLEFIAGKQWPNGIKSERDSDGRPCLVINKIPQFINQITNDQRQNRPSIKVHPVDDHGDVETAKVYQGLIRHIEYNSNAEAAYDTGFEFAVKIGRGFFRVVTQYVDPISFEQEILIKRIPNPLSVSFDPFSIEPDGSDAGFAFVSEVISKDEYIARYPKSKLALSDDWAQYGDSSPGWVTGSNGARVAEYFYKEMTDDTVCQLSNGETKLKSELSDMMMDEMGQPISIIQERSTQVPRVCWAKINGAEVLEKTIWPGKYIPIIPEYGTDLNINGKRIFKGVVEDAMDPARMYNYWASAETEAIALAPRAPFIAAAGQLKGFETIWATANKKNHAVLQYNPTSSSGQVMPPPQRQAFEPAVQAITQARMLASDDLKATTGIYDAALGAKSNETSGVAIQRRNVQAQTSNFHFIDNLTRSLRHTGRILIDLIPKIYDTARTARIIGEDGEQKVVRINDDTLAKDQQRAFQMDNGTYDVTVDVGPSFQTKRQEAVASIIEMSRANPQLMQFAGDILAKNMDWPGSTEIAERLKKMLPPQLIEDPSQKKEIPPEIQAQMQQMGQMVEQLTGTVNQLQQEREMNLLQLESKERIEFKKLEVQLEIERAKLDAKDSHALLSAEIDQINNQSAQIQAMYQAEQSEISNQSAGGNAMGGEVEPNAIGGAPPSQPLEGNSNDDPSAI